MFFGTHPEVRIISHASWGSRGDWGGRWLPKYLEATILNIARLFQMPTQ